MSDTKNAIDAAAEAYASNINAAIVTRICCPNPVSMHESTVEIQQAEPLTDEEIAELNAMFGDGYDWSQEEDWYTIADFKIMVDEGMIHWDQGGIVRVRVNEEDTKYHLGIWMLHKEDNDSVPVTLEQLDSWHTANHNVTVEWANK